MSDSGHVLVERSEGIATITIDRPEKLNALSAEVLDDLAAAFRSLGGEEEVHGVIVTGAGERAFVAGADVEALVELGPEEARRVSRCGQEVFSAIESFPRPVLAAVRGYALGGGLELAMACHLRVASDDARFGLPELGLGTIPGYGGTVRLARLVGLGRALEMILTGERIDAARALDVGLVNRVVSPDELKEAARELMRRVLRNGPVAVRMAMQCVYHAQDVASAEAFRLESALFGILASTGDMREGMSAFLERRDPEFQGR